jgi:homoserine O-acetyltransferase
MLLFMSRNPVLHQQSGPTLRQADEAINAYVATTLKRLDANDVLYALESSSDYDPGPDLEKIRLSI